jgi:drug/metabolite transporter (DMT)-like permease
VKTLALALTSVAASAAGQLLLAAGARAPRGAPGAAGAGPQAERAAAWLWLLLDHRVLGGLACWTASTLLWLLVLQRERLSFAYTLTSLNYVLVPLAARFVLGERLGGIRMVGMALIALGVGVTVAGRASEAP